MIRNEAGKILKPETFSEADISPIIAEQIYNGVQTVE